MPNYFFKKPREIKFTQILIPAKLYTFKVAIDLSDWLDIRNAYSVYCFYFGSFEIFISRNSVLKLLSID